ALSWTPTLSQYLVRRKDKDKKAVTAPASSEGPNMAALLAAEEAHLSGFFGRIVGFYTRAMQAIVKRPWTLAGSSVVIILLSYVCYSFVGTDFLPEMDEGGFILDYYTPPGSSLAESNRILLHIEDILHSTPEVENTSRRTGMQLGLAAVTEANNGDFTVKLKKDRQRGIDDVIEDVRSEIKHTEPAADIEFVQLLQDMIGDLTSQPEPIVIRLFSQDGKLLNDTAPRVADAIGKIQIGKSRPVVDVLDGVEHTISGPAVTFQVNPTATLGSLATVTSDPGETEIRRENLQRLVQVTARLEGVDMGTGVAAVQKAVRDMHLPSSIRIQYGGLYEEDRKSSRDLMMVLLL